MKQELFQVTRAGGVQTRLPPEPNNAAEAVNLVVDRRTGGWSTRLGYEPYYPDLTNLFSPFNNVGPITSLHIAQALAGGARQHTFFESEGSLFLLYDADKPASLLARSHLELELGDLMKTRVSFTDRAGNAVERAMDPIVAGLRQGEFYRDQKTPDGSWTFTGSKGLTVTPTFDRDQVDFTWLYAYPAELNELEVEVSAKSVTLAPGEQITFSHTIELSQAVE